MPLLLFIPHITFSQNPLTRLEDENSSSTDIRHPYYTFMLFP